MTDKVILTGRVNYFDKNIILKLLDFVQEVIRTNPSSLDKFHKRQLRNMDLQKNYNTFYDNLNDAGHNHRINIFIYNDNNVYLHLSPINNSVISICNVLSNYNLSIPSQSKPGYLLTQYRINLPNSISLHFTDQINGFISSTSKSTPIYELRFKYLHAYHNALNGYIDTNNEVYNCIKDIKACQKCKLCKLIYRDNPKTSSTILSHNVNDYNLTLTDKPLDKIDRRKDPNKQSYNNSNEMKAINFNYQVLKGIQTNYNIDIFCLQENEKPRFDTNKSGKPQKTSCDSWTTIISNVGNPIKYSFYPKSKPPHKKSFTYKFINRMNVITVHMPTRTDINKIDKSSKSYDDIYADKIIEIFDTISKYKYKVPDIIVGDFNYDYEKFEKVILPKIQKPNFKISKPESCGNINYTEIGKHRLIDFCIYNSNKITILENKIIPLFYSDHFPIFISAQTK